MKVRTVISLFALSASLSLFSADWPQYRGPAHDGKSPEKMSDWPAGGPRALWKVPTPNGFSSFAVKDNRAFTLVSREVEGVAREVLIALDAETGKELWSAAFTPADYEEGGNSGAPRNSGGDGPRSTPAIDGGRVYVLTADLVLACYRASNGTEFWKRDIIRENNGHNISWKSAASPVIEGELVFVAGGGSGQALLGINKYNGQVVWSTGSDKMTHATPVIATIHGVRQVLFLTQKALVSVKPEDGTVLWRHPVRYNVSTAASPVVADDIVYCSAGYGIGATVIQVTKNGDEFSAEELWRKPGNQLANHWSTPVYKDGYLYGMFQFKEYGEGPIKCVDVKTGAVKWSKPGFGPGNVILVGDQLVALSDEGQLVQIDPDPAAYKEKARFQAITGKCWSTPAFANGKLFVRSTKEGAAFEVSSRLAQN
jgi:outer membrane protein assembly factor BamB